MKTAQKYYTIAIPTKTYLKKYISLKFGFAIKVNMKNLIGVMVYNMALKKVDSKISHGEQTERLKGYDSDLVLIAPVSCMPKVGVSLSQHSIIQLNRFFDAMLISDLYEYCKANTASDQRRKGYDKAIMKFADCYFLNLDSDITFDALKQMEFRYRKRLNNKLACFDTSHC